LFARRVGETLAAMDEQRTPVHGNRWPRATTVASTLPALLACSDRQIDTGFRITGVAFDNDSTITLTFSQPVADLADVDPNNFRLSMGQTLSVTYSYGGITETYQYTSYRDLATVVYNYNYYGGYRFSFMSIERGASANQVILRTTDALGPTSCEFIDYATAQFEMYADYYDPNAQFDLAMFLHYAAGDIPVESESGVPLTDIGAAWVLTSDTFSDRQGFGFTMLSPQLRIPCP
jgi:hypothetical protein